jgi:hypothetical protein
MPARIVPKLLPRGGSPLAPPHRRIEASTGKQLMVAAAAPADDRHRLPRRHLERDAFQDRPARIVGEGDLIERDIETVNISAPRVSRRVVTRSQAGL